jgi:hypothetical protein
MTKRRCPVCGAMKFLTSDRGPKTMFQVFEDWSIEIIQAESEQQIDKDRIYCAACSWKGPLNQLIQGL